jgi:hypothetical protein
MDWQKIAILGAMGAARAGLGVWKNSAGETFEFRIKKAVPTVIVGGLAGVVIGSQELGLDENLELYVEALAVLGVTSVIEDAWKGVWRRIQKTGWYKLIAGIDQNG